MHLMQNKEESEILIRNQEILKMKGKEIKNTILRKVEKMRSMKNTMIMVNNGLNQKQRIIREEKTVRIKRENYSNNIQLLKNSAARVSQ